MEQAVAPACVTILLTTAPTPSVHGKGKELVPVDSGGGWSLGLLVQWGLATWCFCPPMSPREMPPGCGRGGGGTVFPELRSNQSCWQGTAGTVGRGRLAAPLRAHPPATSGEGPPR